MCSLAVMRMAENFKSAKAQQVLHILCVMRVLQKKRAAEKSAAQKGAMLFFVCVIA